MVSVQQQLNELVQAALDKHYPGVDLPLSCFIKPSTRPEFGDFQANVALPLAKIVGENPRQCAEKLLAELSNHQYFAKCEIAGPGFINMTMDNAYLTNSCAIMLGDGNLGIQTTENPQTVVIDYSSANVAKEMHVGHLRSTVIGDAITRLLTFLGHKVIRQNHLGDWGTQFGMIIEWMLENNWQPDNRHTMAELNALYKNAKKKFDDDEDFTKRARKRVVALQSGDAQTRQLWQGLVDESVRYFQTIYDRLQVLLQPEDVRGESSYNDDLSDVIDALKNAGVLTESQGAMVAFLDGFVDPNGKPLPYIVRKSDGGYLYATTDIAAARYRLNELKANRLIYVTDARQKQHFAMLFSLLRKCGWVDDSVSLEHIAFGSILGPDRKPYKTREGEVINLSTLLDEAKDKALNLVKEKQSDIDEASQQHIADVISIGAIKYADLSTDRIKDVIFNWEKMLAFEGNTAPYLQNAFVRIQAIFRKAKAQSIDWSNTTNLSLSIESEHEHQLAVLLLSFSDLLDSVSVDLAIHRICHYLFEVASHFHRFYEHCPVMTAETQAQRLSRLQLCQLTANVLQTGLSLLGISTLEKM